MKIIRHQDARGQIRFDSAHAEGKLPVCLKHGDTVWSDIERIGALTNHWLDEPLG
ncbi:MAG: hypothetical protein NTV29_12330 [Planctomycetota bacterium]|nr:hypothetical protein [Planctomycetota bacterium]